jgi:hypothetical protein
MVSRRRKLLRAFILLLLSTAQAFGGAEIVSDTPVEVIGIRNMGLSAADETKSVIEIEWRVNNALHPNGESFNLTLEVVYASGVSLIFETRVEGATARSTQIEVPALHTIPGRVPAAIKQVRAIVMMANPAQRISARE